MPPSSRVRLNVPCICHGDKAPKKEIRDEYHGDRRDGVVARSRIAHLAAQCELGILPQRGTGFNPPGPGYSGPDRPAPSGSLRDWWRLFEPSRGAPSTCTGTGTVGWKRAVIPAGERI